MQILYYRNSGDENLTPFEQELATLATDGRIESYRELAQLEGGLLRPHLSDTMLVALLTENTAFIDFASLERLLQDLSLILILPDQTARTVARAHQLKPRFVTSLEADFRVEVLAVAQKIMINHQRSEEAMFGLMGQAPGSKRGKDQTQRSMVRAPVPHPRDSAGNGAGTAEDTSANHAPKGVSHGGKG
jgi:hypothetical protein